MVTPYLSFFSFFFFFFFSSLAVGVVVVVVGVVLWARGHGACDDEYRSSCPAGTRTALLLLHEIEGRRGGRGGGKGMLRRRRARMA